MKNKLLVLILNLVLCLTGTNSVAQETVKGLDENKDLPTLNKILRRSARRLNAIENGISLTSGITGILPLANGGTGAPLVDPGADRIYFWDESGNITDWLIVGTGLTLTGTTITAAQPTSNVIFAWSGVDACVDTDYGLYVGQNLLEAAGSSNINNVYLYSEKVTSPTILNFKFTKIAGISTVTIHARLWAVDNVATNEAFVEVTIGTATAQTAKSVTSATPTWYEGATPIDVSGLVNGTTYDGAVKLYAEQNARPAYCSAITLIGS